MRFHRRKVGLGIVLLIGVAVTGWYVFAPAPEPVYKGRTLSSWLEQYALPVNPIVDTGRLSGGSIPQPDAREAQIRNEQARDAIVHIGPDAIPALLRMLSARDSATKSFITNHLTPKLRARLRISNESWQKYIDYSTTAPRNALLAFQILGPSASNAAPGLLHVMCTTPNPIGMNAAYSSLVCLGPAGRVVVPDLVRNLRNPREPVRSLSLSAIYAFTFDHSRNTIRPDFIPLVLPPLIEILEDPHADVPRMNMLLRGLANEPAEAMAHLEPLLKSRNPQTAASARLALQKIKPAK